MDGDMDTDTARKLEIYQRVDEAFNSIGLTGQVRRGKAIGVDQSTISKWKRGEFAPSNLNMLDISELTGYEFNWLWTGRGPKIAPPGDPESDRINRILRAVDPETRALIRRLAEEVAGAKKPPE